MPVFGEAIQRLGVRHSYQAEPTHHIIGDRRWGEAVRYEKIDMEKLTSFWLTTGTCLESCKEQDT